MYFHSAVNQYKDVETNSKVETADKHKFILIVLEELHKNLNTLIFTIENDKKSSPAKSKSFSKIISSLMILMNSLDFDNGEPIASNLFNLYEYCRNEVLIGYKELKTDGIKSAENVISDILSSWKEIN